MRAHSVPENQRVIRQADVKIRRLVSKIHEISMQRVGGDIVRKKNGII